MLNGLTSLGFLVCFLGIWVFVSPSGVGDLRMAWIWKGLGIGCLGILLVPGEVCHLVCGVFPCFLFRGRAGVEGLGCLFWTLMSVGS